MLAGAVVHKWVLYFRKPVANMVLELSEAAEWDQVLSEWCERGRDEFFMEPFFVEARPWDRDQCGGLIAEPHVELMKTLDSFVDRYTHQIRTTLPIDGTVAPVSFLYVVFFFDGVTISGRCTTRGGYRLVGVLPSGERFMSEICKLFDMWGLEYDVWDAVVAKTHHQKVLDFYQSRPFYMLPDGQSVSKPFTNLQCMQMTSTILKTTSLKTKVNGTYKAHFCLLCWPTLLASRSMHSKTGRLSGC